MFNNFSQKLTNDMTEKTSTNMIYEMLNKWLITINWDISNLNDLLKLSGMKPPFKFSFLHNNYLEFYCEDVNDLQVILSLQLINDSIYLTLKYNNCEELYKCIPIKKRSFFKKQVNILNYAYLLKKIIKLPEQNIRIIAGFFNFHPINYKILLNDKSILEIKLIDVLGVINFFTGPVASKERYNSLNITLEKVKAYILSLKTPILDLRDIYNNILNIYSIKKSNLEKSSEFLLYNYMKENNNVKVLSKLHYQNNNLIDAAIRNDKNETILISKNSSAWEYYSDTLNIIFDENNSINVGFTPTTPVADIHFVDILEYIENQIQSLKKQLFD